MAKIDSTHKKWGEFWWDRYDRYDGNKVVNEYAIPIITLFKHKYNIVWIAFWQLLAAKDGGYYNRNFTEIMGKCKTVKK